VTDVLTHPASGVGFAREPKVAIGAPRAFIAAPGFVGPDRRTRRTPAWPGNERRLRMAKKTKVGFPETAPSGDGLIFVRRLELDFYPTTYCSATGVDDRARQSRKGQMRAKICHGPGG